MNVEFLIKIVQISRCFSIDPLIVRWAARNARYTAIKLAGSSRTIPVAHKSQPGRTKLEDDLRYGRRPVTAS